MKNGMRKNKGKKWILAMLVFSLACSGLAGCGSSEESVKNSVRSAAEDVYENDAAEYGMQGDIAEAKPAEDAESYEEQAELEETADAEAVDSGETDAAGGGVHNTDMTKKDTAKIIKKYHYDYETETFDDACSYLKEEIEKYNGYVSSSQIEGNGYRTLQLTARIPAQVSDEFTAQLGSLGTLVSQSESATDVTLQYADTESRITSLETEQKRLNALLEKADSLENIIALEDRLTEVRYELENYQSQKKLYDDLISYSTVNIVLSEVNYTVETDDSSVISRISTGLQVSFRNIKDGFTDFFVWLVVALPYLIIWAIVLFVLIKVIRIIIRRRRKKKLSEESLEKEKE